MDEEDLIEIMNSVPTEAFLESLFNILRVNQGCNENEKLRNAFNFGYLAGMKMCSEEMQGKKALIFNNLMQIHDRIEIDRLYKILKV